MNERLVARLAPAALVAVLGLAMLVPAPAGLGIRPRDPAREGDVEAVLDEIPAGGLVALGFDPDVGTYSEIRAGVRTLIARLAAKDVTVAWVSLTPEGRALAVAELARADLAGGGATVVDLGFVPGAEAALASLSRGSPVAAGAGDEGLPPDGLAGANLLVVVGGNDIGPRPWVEQFLPRVADVPVIAVTPTLLLPEILPYLESGQLDAVLGTPGDAAAFAATAGDTDRPVSPLAVLVGLVAAAGAVAHGVLSRAVPAARSSWRQRA